MKKRVLPVVILTAYSALLIKFLVFKEVSFRLGHLMFDFSGGTPGPANFIPFKTISLYLFNEKGLIITLFELVGNIGLLIPFGFLLPFVYRKMTWYIALSIAITVPIIIELMQVIFQVGIFDVDDVILNAIGVMIGYGLAKAFLHKNAVQVRIL